MLVTVNLLITLIWWLFRHLPFFWCNKQKNLSHFVWSVITRVCVCMKDVGECDKRTATNYRLIFLFNETYDTSLQLEYVVFVWMSISLNACITRTVCVYLYLCVHNYKYKFLSTIIIFTKIGDNKIVCGGEIYSIKQHSNCVCVCIRM